MNKSTKVGRIVSCDNEIVFRKPLKKRVEVGNNGRENNVNWLGTLAFELIKKCRRKGVQKLSKRVGKCEVFQSISIK